MIKKFKFLLIHDEKISSYNQAFGLINSIKKYAKSTVQITSREFNPKFIGYLPNLIIYYILHLKYLFFNKELDNKTVNCIICCGRVSAPLSLIYKKKYNIKLISILDPYFKRDYFDRIIIPFHDEKKNGDNIIYLTGSLVNESLKTIPNSTKQKFLKLIPNNRKIITILIGGSGKSAAISKSEISSLSYQLKKIDINKYNLNFLFSRRTNDFIKEIIKNNFHNKSYIWDENSENPYWYLLNKSEYIIITEDSISMISEAISFNKPVYIFLLRKIKSKIRRFNQDLLNKGIIKVFNGLVKKWEYNKINETKRIAINIIDYLKI